MATRHISNYVKKRFRAHRNLLRILGKQGAQYPLRNPPLPNEEDLDLLTTYDPQNEAEFRIAWREKQNDNNRTVVFERDAQSVWFHAHPDDEFNDYIILIVFLVPESGGDKIINKVLDLYLKPHMLQLGYQEGSLVVNDNLQVIIQSDAPLDGQARNQLIDFNLLLRRGIRHFTTDELKFDPTDHIMQPRAVTKASEEEIERFVEQQKGFMIGSTRLAGNLEERIQEAETDDEVEEINDEATKEIIEKIPTINSSDPLVKWNGFRVNDILKIYRRIGQTEFTFRRVIFNSTTI